MFGAEPAIAAAGAGASMGVVATGENLLVSRRMFQVLFGAVVSVARAEIVAGGVEAEAGAGAVMAAEGRAIAAVAWVALGVGVTAA